ncbi:MAG: ceramidase domain-containing protein [Betaproteobacteria bacterium]|nr:ceramidase domain-containing protein [Betaproteobacteria bacterium]
MIDLYCERVAPGLSAEPINALTNVAFFIAAWAAWSLARRTQAVSADIWMLIVLSIVIGAGSALFHTFAMGWARILDEVPILLFQLWYLWLYLRRITAQRPAIAAASIAGYLAAAYLGRQFPHLLNGSLVYAPALILMPCLGLYHFLQHKAGRCLLLAATGVFLISLVFRLIDEDVCSYVPAGTHFLWHILNGVVLYLSMRALILNRPGRPA